MLSWLSLRHWFFISASSIANQCISAIFCVLSLLFVVPPVLILVRCHRISSFEIYLPVFSPIESKWVDIVLYLVTLGTRAQSLKVRKTTKTQRECLSSDSKSNWIARRFIFSIPTSNWTPHSSSTIITSPLPLRTHWQPCLVFSRLLMSTRPLLGYILNGSSTVNVRSMCFNLYTFQSPFQASIPEYSPCIWNANWTSPGTWR